MCINVHISIAILYDSTWFCNILHIDSIWFHSFSWMFYHWVVCFCSLCFVCCCSRAKEQESRVWRVTLPRFCTKQVLRRLQHLNRSCRSKGMYPPEKINVFPKRDHVKSKCHLPTIDFVSFQGCIITKCLLFLKESILGTLDPPSWNRYLN